MSFLLIPSEKSLRRRHNIFARNRPHPRRHKCQRPRRSGLRPPLPPAHLNTWPTRYGTAAAVPCVRPGSMPFPAKGIPMPDLCSSAKAPGRMKTGREDLLWALPDSCSTR